MSKIIFRTVLVVGDNADKLIRKYDLDTKVDPYIKMKRSDAKEIQKKHLKMIEDIINSDKIPMTERQNEAYKNIYLDVKEMGTDEYFESVTQGCTYDDNTGDAYTTENPIAMYQHACNPQKSLSARNEEHDFCNPFFLNPLDDEERGDVISYTAKKGEIDWGLMHMHNTDIYKRAWEMCVDGDEPKTEQEKTIKSNMEQRIDYFNNFDTVDDYVSHSCSFWCYGYLDKNGYKELDYSISDKEWVRTFYDRFVAPLKEDETLSLYVVRAIE